MQDQPTPPGRARRSRRRGRATRRLVAVALLLLAPVPWLHLVDDAPPGMAWRLDGRLVVQGAVVDPPGRWSWLTVGRPPHALEVAWGWLAGGPEPRDLRDAPTANRPAINEPTAATVGLRHAGVDVDFGLLVEVEGPRSPRHPERAVVVRMAGTDLTDLAAWKAVQAGGAGPMVFETDEGRVLFSPSSRLPYTHIRVTEVATSEVEAAVGGRWSNLPPVGWFRNLALGRSHGLMVAVVTYADAADHDLARGRHVAGTGGVAPDGTVTPIGGLTAKAAAARDAGADVLLFPAAQQAELGAFDAGGMALLPVASVGEAIAALTG